MLNALSAERTLGRLARFPLKLVPPTAVLPILTGKLRGKKWIVGSGIHGCWLGLYEHEKQRQIAREVRANTIFYDVGAHVGFYSLLASVLVGSGKVYAFEPAPRNLAYLRQHLVLNCVANVDVLPVAISDRVGTASFCVDLTSYTGHLSGEGAFVVRTEALDSLVENGRIPPPDHVKMDIEGAELKALNGAQKTLQRYRPVLFLATHGRQVHSDCCCFLRSLGYECTMVDHNGELRELVARCV
jgi:FkbM family methyltransferase